MGEGGVQAAIKKKKKKAQSNLAGCDKARHTNTHQNPTRGRSEVLTEHNGAQRFQSGKYSRFDRRSDHNYSCSGGHKDQRRRGGPAAKPGSQVNVIGRGSAQGRLCNCHEAFFF